MLLITEDFRFVRLNLPEPWVVPAPKRPFLIWWLQVAGNFEKEDAKFFSRWFSFRRALNRFFLPRQKGKPWMSQSIEVAGHVLQNYKYEAVQSPAALWESERTRTRRLQVSIAREVRKANSTLEIMIMMMFPRSFTKMVDKETENICRHQLSPQVNS